MHRTLNNTDKVRAWPAEFMQGSLSILQKIVTHVSAKHGE